MTDKAPAITFDEVRHEYRVNGVVCPSVTQVLEAAGISDFSMVPPATLEHAAKRGTAVHQAAWYDDQDDLDESTVSPECMGYLTAWRKFRGESIERFDLIESRVVSPLGYAGTFDRLVFLRKWGLTLLDLKTGAESPSWRIQLAAYVKAAFGVGALGCRRAAVALRTDGTYTVHWYDQKDLTRDFNVFTAALAVYQFRKEHKLV